MAGLLSYGLYLYHWPIIVWLTPETTGWGRGPLDLARVGFAVAASAVSYLLVERPVRFGSWVTVRSVAVTAPVLLVGSAVVAGWAMRVPAIGLERLVDVTIPSAPQAAPATVAPPTSSPGPSTTVAPGQPEPPSTAPPAPTTTGAPVLTTVAPLPIEPPAGRPLRVAYVGDSIGVQVSPYLDVVLGEEVDYVDLTFAGSALCDWFPDLERLLDDPVDVLVVDHGGNALSPCMFDDDDQPLRDDAYVAKYQADIAFTIDLAEQMGARVLLVDQPVSRQDLTSGTGWMYQDAAEADTTGTVRYFSTWPAITPGGVFVQSAPCAEWEPGCIDGQGEIRSPPPGVHLEPLGQFRYALALRDDLALAGWLPIGST